jgi:hypothetical protein
VGQTRRFPLDEPAAGPLRARSASAAPAPTPTATRWPVLARIAELNRMSEADAAPKTESARTSYRVDASHSAAE